MVQIQPPSGPRRLSTGGARPGPATKRERTGEGREIDGGAQRCAAKRDVCPAMID